LCSGIDFPTDFECDYLFEGIDATLRLLSLPFFFLNFWYIYILNILVLKKIINFVQKGDCAVAEHAAPVVVRAVEDAAQVAVVAVNHPKYNSLKYNSLDYKD